MARVWHYTKLSLSSVLLLYFFLAGVVSVSLRYVFFCSRWSFVDVPLIFFCPADHVVPDWQPRSILLGIVEARSVNVKKTTTIIVVVFFTLTDRASTKNVYDVLVRLVPAPSETCWFRGMSVGGSFRRV